MSDLAWGRFGPLSLAIALAVAAGLWLEPLGLALSPDGAHYMNVALRIAHDGISLVDPKYPVGYPLLVRLVMPFDPFPMDAALWVSLISFAVTLAGVGSLARRLSSHAAWPFAAVLGCAFFIPFWNAHLYALSEAPFTALLVLQAVCVARHLELARTDARGALRWFALAAVCVGLSATVRVMGYALIAAFTAYALASIVRASKDPGLRARLLAAHALSYLPAAAIAAANLVAGRAVHGDRPAAQQAEAFWRNAELAGSTLGSDLGVALMSTLVASTFAFVVYRQRTKSRAAPQDNTDETDETGEAESLYLYLLILVLAYVPVLVIGASLTKISPVGTRFLVPIYPLMFVLALGAARFAPPALRTLGAVLALLSFAHVIGLGAPELKRRVAEFDAVAHDATATHVGIGFDAAPAARTMQAFLRDGAASEKGAPLSAIFPMPRGGQHARLARALLFRGSSVGEGEGAFDLEVSTSDALTLHFEPNPWPLRYYDLPITGQDPLNPQTLLGAVYGVMQTRRHNRHWLLTPRGGDPLQATGELVSGPLQLVERREVGGYNAYLFELR